MGELHKERTGLQVARQLTLCIVDGMGSELSSRGSDSLRYRRKSEDSIRSDIAETWGKQTETDLSVLIEGLASLVCRDFVGFAQGSIACLGGLCSSGVCSVQSGSSIHGGHHINEPD